MEGNNLPVGWAECALSDIAGLQNGFAFKSGGYVAEGHFLIRIGNVQDKGIDLSKPVYVDISDSKTTPFELNEGDILMSLTGNIGRVAVIGKQHLPAALNQRVARIFPLNQHLINSRFLVHLLKAPAYFEQISATAKGAAQQNISGKDVLGASVLLPPLPEQTRIANKLDELLAQVNTIKARVDSIPGILKRFRQSVLAAAVSGRLTEEWRQGHHAPYAVKSLGEIGVLVKTGPFGSALHKKDYIESGIPVINPMHINDGAIAPSVSMTISEGKFEKLSAWALEEGDVIVGRRGEMGRAALVQGEHSGFLCGTGSMILRCNGTGLLPEYLTLVIRSPLAIQYFVASSVGSTMVNLNQKIIKGLEVHYPSEAEQLEIVERVEAHFRAADLLARAVQAAALRVDRLTQSILAKAFRGELVPQNPDDEPASVLLERIKAG